jgi:hypothetical protein
LRFVYDDVYQLVLAQKTQDPLAPVPFKPDFVSELDRDLHAFQLLRADEDVA